jgi:hypothetical protein
MIVASMDYDLSAESWQIVRSLLPADWRSSARELGALTRARGVKDEEVLLQLLMMHTAGGLSLKQTSMRAAELGIAEISSVALFKRLRCAEPWLRHLSAQMVQGMAAKMKELPQSGRRWRIMDATDIVEPGRTGSHWNLHYSLRLPELACDHFEVSDQQGGESFVRLPVKPADVVIADRGYAHRRGIAYLLDAKADVLVRVRFRNALFDENEDPLPLLEKLRGLKQSRCGEWSVSFVWENKRYKARLCAVRKSALHAAQARKKALNKSRRKGQQIKPLTLELADYVLILTTLPKTDYSTKEILEIYRCRWQVELAFKRLKGLLAIGYVPKTDPDSARAWMQGKVLAALLIDKILRQGRFFSPWGLVCE